MCMRLKMTTREKRYTYSSMSRLLLFDIKLCENHDDRNNSAQYAQWEWLTVQLLYYCITLRTSPPHHPAVANVTKTVFALHSRLVAIPDFIAEQKYNQQKLTVSMKPGQTKRAFCSTRTARWIMKKQNWKYTYCIYSASAKRASCFPQRMRTILWLRRTWQKKTQPPDIAEYYSAVTFCIAIGSYLNGVRKWPL